MHSCHLKRSRSKLQGCSSSEPQQPSWLWLLGGQEVVIRNMYLSQKYYLFFNMFCSFFLFSLKKNPNLVSHPLSVRIHSPGSEPLTTISFPVTPASLGSQNTKAGEIEFAYEIRGREEARLLSSQTASCPMRRRTLPMLICSKARSKGGSDTEERRKR